MTYKEEKRDLFRVDTDYYLAHCISADFALGAGIAKEFNRRFHTRRKLFKLYPNSRVKYWDNVQDNYKGMMTKTDNVYNLITKRNYWDKPTLQTLKNSLEWMKEDALYSGVRKIAMPKIGCGLDRLKWDDVSRLIQEMFEDTDIEILVCIL